MTPTKRNQATNGPGSTRAGNGRASTEILPQPQRLGLKSGSGAGARKAGTGDIELGNDRGEDKEGESPEERVAQLKTLLNEALKELVYLHESQEPAGVYTQHLIEDLIEALK